MDDLFIMVSLKTYTEYKYEEVVHHQEVVQLNGFQKDYQNQ